LLCNTDRNQSWASVCSYPCTGSLYFLFVLVYKCSCYSFIEDDWKVNPQSCIANKITVYNV
jgi:hypothetical protein